MAENSESNDPKYASGKLPPFGDFVGRERELRVLEEFLTRDSSVPSIMLVHGPRGMGKSALVREAARRKKDQYHILWMNRGRLAELLYDGEENRRPLSSQYKPDLHQFQEAEVANYLDYFMSSDGNQKINYEQAYAILSMSLSKMPFLLIVDDFDEHDSLGDDPSLCEQLAQIENPNKVILTTRLLRNAFQQKVYQTLELGLLQKDDVNRIVLRSGLKGIDKVLLPGGSLEIASDYVWLNSSGHAEFITRFLLLTIEQEPWLLNDAEREYVFGLFASHYINRRMQAALLEDYSKKDGQESTIVAKLKRLDLHEKDVLFALCDSDNSTPLGTYELALNLGYCPQERGELLRFYRLLQNLLNTRLIGRQIEEVSSEKDIRLADKWTFFPFAKNYIREQLLAVETEAVLRKRQTTRWIRFLQCYSEEPKIIDPCVDSIYSIFSWCFCNQVWRDALELGILLSRALQNLKFHEGNSKQRELHADVCQKTAEAAQQPGIEEWRIAVEQWIQLAHLYSNDENNPILLEMAFDYASKAAKILDDPKDSVEKKIWANAVCLIAKVCVHQGNVTKAQEWLERAEQQGRLDDNWILSAYLLAKLYLGNKDWKNAENWLVRLINAFETHKGSDILVQASIDLAHLYMVQGQSDKSLFLLKRAKEAVEKLNNPSSETVQLIIKAIVMEAQIAFYEDNDVECRRYLEHAMDLAKYNKIDSVVNELQRWLAYVLLRNSPFNPTDEIEKLFGKHYWRIEVNVRCPICQNAFDFQNEPSNYLWLCSNPDCNTYFHMACLQETSAGECPSCKTKIEIS